MLQRAVSDDFRRRRSSYAPPPSGSPPGFLEAAAASVAASVSSVPSPGRSLAGSRSDPGSPVMARRSRTEAMREAMAGALALVLPDVVAAAEGARTSPTTRQRVQLASSPGLVARALQSLHDELGQLETLEEHQLGEHALRPA
jgi:hypothetical protein